VLLRVVRRAVRRRQLAESEPRWRHVFSSAAGLYRAGLPISLANLKDQGHR
jgi:hypothetical protein